MGAFAWSPDGSKIAFSATVNPDLVQGVTSDIYVLTLADDSIKKLVRNPGPTTVHAGRRMESKSSFPPRWGRRRISPATRGWQ